MLRNKLHTIIFVVLLAVPVSAQYGHDKRTFVGGGVTLTYSTAVDPSPDQNRDGGRSFAGAYGEAAYELPKGFQIRGAGQYGDPVFPTIFSYDEERRDAGRFAKSELSLSA